MRIFTLLLVMMFIAFWIEQDTIRKLQSNLAASYIVNAEQRDEYLLVTKTQQDKIENLTAELEIAQRFNQPPPPNASNQ